MAISDKTRKLLWGRSGNRCAICRCELIMEATNEDDESIIGDECHIAAKNLGGARNNHALSDDEVNGYENLLLLCKVHHKMIDDQRNTYTVEILKKIKADHEQWIRETLEHKPEQRAPSEYTTLELPENEVLRKIRSRGYWHVILRPRTYHRERIASLREAQRIVEENQIRHRGWYFPHTDSRDLHRGVEYVESNSEFREIKEHWRYYEDGRFIFCAGLGEDWFADDRSLAPNDWLKRIQPGAVLDILSVLYQVSEIYEFAARLAERGVFGSDIVVRINLVNMEGRQLVFLPGTGRRLSLSYTYHAKELPRESVVSMGDMVSHWTTLAYKHFAWITDKFGFDASDSVFVSDQGRFLQERY